LGDESHESSESHESRVMKIMCVEDHVCRRSCVSEEYDGVVKVVEGDSDYRRVDR
jgi:hypothetical protein